METVVSYILIFFICSFLGWVQEIFQALYHDHKFINRGFLIGPYCPIYGFGALIMIIYLDQYKNNIITVFLLSTILCSILEYVTSYLMEKIFKARWWDYSNNKFNLNGRICLLNSCLFGIAGVILVCFIEPFLLNLINYIPFNIALIISIILTVIFIVDMILSFEITARIKITAEKVIKDNTEEISKKVREVLNSKLFLRRTLKAFPKFEKNLLKELKNKLNRQNVSK